jgi:hypothetical protein
MRWWRRAALAGALVLAGCASVPVAEPAAPAAVRPDSAPQAVIGALVLDPRVEARILALDPQRVSDGDVREVLALGPTPRIVALHGGIYPVHLVMESFSRFLASMGYPAHKLRHPGDGRRSHSPYENSLQIAGLIAWYYENEGLMPMLVGHSQGGIQLVKVLHDLAGDGVDRIAVWNPHADAAEPRFSIVDPFSGARRPVVGLKIGYASVVASGGAALLLPNQWSMARRLRTIPDTVGEFTGYALAVDLVAWDLPGAGGRYRTAGAAQVRNVQLPADYSHVYVARSAHLARDPALRDWVNAYAPDRVPPLPEDPVSSENILWAADVWFHIKKHWVLEAQKVVRARRDLARRQAGLDRDGVGSAPALPARGDEALH